MDNTYRAQGLYGSAPCTIRTGMDTVNKEVLLTHEHTLTLSTETALLQRFTCSPAQLTELCIGWLCSQGCRFTGEMAENLHISGDGHSAVIPQEVLQKQEIAPFSAPAEVDAALCRQAAALLNGDNNVHGKTRGTHGCVFASADGAPIFCEDISRNSAMDKTMGSVLLQHRTPGEGLLFSSGRISADIVRKAVCAGFPVLVSKAAVTAEALAEAQRYRLRLAFFADGTSCTMSAEL